MDQNTAQNNKTQFSYPDFSSNNQGQAQGQPQTQQNQVTDDSKKIDELKKDLDSLKSAQDSAPLPPNPNQSSTPAPATNVDQNDNGGETYVQEPKPLPGMDKKLPPEETAPVATTVEPPSGEGFDPLPPDLPKFNETLDNIMPETKEKKQEDKEQEQVKQEPQDNPQQESSENISPKKEMQVKKDMEDLEKTPMSTDGEVTMHQLLSETANRGASDLHIADGYPPIIRVDGELVSLGGKLLNPEDTERLIFSIINDEKKELLEVNREIDFAYTYEGAMNARFRVNAYYSMKNLSAALRLIPSRIRTIEELMLPQLYHQFAKLKQGLILVTGPTGHGKSTTIASMLEDINRTRFCHIVTIEDPIEYVFEGKKALIDQREMSDDTHSWNIALRSALRQDPDVILVGEMRDFETIASAITLAETGHLVFATLHTNSAAQTLDRIIDVFPENQQQQVRTQVAHTLEAVIAQRLIPMEKGGRRAVSEIMLNNAAVSNLIREGKMYQVDNVIRTSADIGMLSLERSLVNLVREGVITVQTAQQYAVHPEEVLRLMKA